MQDTSGIDFPVPETSMISDSGQGASVPALPLIPAAEAPNLHISYLYLLKSLLASMGQSSPHGFEVASAMLHFMISLCFTVAL